MSSYTTTVNKITTPTESEYKSKPTLILPPLTEKGQAFQFGVTKAKIILANLPAIEAFVKKHSGATNAQEAQIRQSLKARGLTDEEINKIFSGQE